MDAFLHFLSHFQKEQLSEEEVKQLIEVGLTWILQILSINRSYLTDSYIIFILKMESVSIFGLKMMVKVV